MNKRKAKKAVKKAVTRKKPNTSRPFATSRELVVFRQNIAKANKRIARLEAEGLEPSILSFVKSTLGDRIRIPRGKALTEQLYNKIKAITERFLRAETSRLKTAREGERKHREAFHERILRAFGEAVGSEAEQRLYYAMGDLDIKGLTKMFTYEEVQFAANQLLTANINLSDDLVTKVLQNNIDYVVIDELEARGIPTGGTTLRDYVSIAVQYGIDEAIKQYQLDQEDETQ